MKRAWQTWMWSLAVVVRSPLPVLALAVFSALWGLAAYQWLWLPESSAFLLLLAFVWAVAQILVTFAVLAGTTLSAAEAATARARRLGLRTLVRISGGQFARSIVMGAASVVIVLVVSALFGWVNSRALEVASFLTFHSEKPVSPVAIEKILWVIECALWTVMGGFLLSFLMIVLRAGWREAWRQAGRTLANCCWRSPFFTSLVSVVVFGGLVYLLVTWHPKVTPGFPDYSQVVLRMGVSLILLVAGWLFLLLSLARISSPTDEGASA